MVATVAGIHLGPDTHANRPAATVPPAGSFYYCSTDDLVYQTDGTTWTTWLDNTGGGGGGAVATDAIWDATGDLAVGTGANTAAKLVKGAAGGALVIANGAVAWNSGTSFPGTPATGDRYWRTDHRLEFAYDGTRWVCTCPHTMTLKPTDELEPSSASGRRWRMPVPYRGSSFTIYIGTMRFVVMVVTTNSGSAYWTVSLYRADSADSKTIIGSSFNTSADSANTWLDKTVTGDAVLASGAFELDAQGIKTGSPGPLRLLGEMDYRLIAT